MSASETVQAAQRLLAEREAVGLKKYGTTVDRTDLSPEQWLQHLIEDLADGLLYALRAQDTRRLLSDLVDSAQPAFMTSESCGATAEYRHVFKFRTLAELQAFGRAWAAVVSMRPTPVTDFNLYTSPDVWTSQPAPAAAPEDAERAAGLKRWKGAPAHATHLAEGYDGRCWWHSRQPWLKNTPPCVEWIGGLIDYAGDNLLGSVRCEPRPVQGVGP